jgi:hypothetical protein
VTGVSANVWNAKGGFLERVIYSSPFKGGGRVTPKAIFGTRIWLFLHFVLIEPKSRIA